MTGKGWITGSDIQSRPYDTEEARDSFDRIFKHGKYSKPKPVYTVDITNIVDIKDANKPDGQ